ncbi:MAG: NUDIX domain-containing protein [Sutterellaceae bacterium]|nr:NUDIX domain-containing protein [Burkholderiaceae bacterium]MCX7902194.1 NUDIX domain-containing protein [Burkholderiaceae bacterium]MDW8430567.1 NUDIX domain-containing protein [Sutterellaceae bacterium]
MSDAGFRFCPRCATPLVWREEGGRDRSACPGCGWVHWDNPVPVVAAVVDYQGRVLLARNAAWPPKIFGLVTGFLERGEAPAAAVAREVKEETDLDARQCALIGVYEFAQRNELIIAYHVVADGTIRLSDELAEYRLIEPARLRPWPFGTGLALADWMRSRGLAVEFLNTVPG